MAVKVIRYLWNNLTGFLIWLTWRVLFQVTVIGKKNLKLIRQQQRNILVIANHQTLIDSWLGVFFCWPWGLFYPSLIPWHAPAKENYFGSLLLRTACYLWQCVPVTREKNEQHQLLRQLSQHLKKGTLMIFPEGGRHLGDQREMRTWKSGAAYLAKQNQAMVLPIAFQGMRQVLPPRKFSPRFYWLPRFFKKITIVIGRPLAPEILSNLDKEQIAQKMRAALQEALDQASDIYFKNPS